MVAAADAPAAFSEQYPRSARLALGIGREALIGAAPAEVRVEMQSLTLDLRDLLIRLSIAMWDRKDAAAVAVIEDCVVGLPTGLLLRRAMPPRDDARRRLAAAVEAILSVGPPQPAGHSRVRKHTCPHNSKSSTTLQF